MMDSRVSDLFSVKDKVAVITGASGVLGSAMAEALAANGAKVVITAFREEGVSRTVAKILSHGGQAIGQTADVTNEESVQKLRDFVLKEYGQVDVLINCAGGNVKEATVADDASFFDVPSESVDKVMNLNFTGTVIPCLVFGKEMVKRPAASIINISSMAAEKATISRVMGYSASKAAVSNFTHWLASDLARKFDGKIRVNAIAPGFFIGAQNRDLLLKSDGTPTDRGNTILQGTPMKRFGNPEELVGTVIWLCSDASKFVTGTVTQVDGGFSAFSGV